LEEKPHHGWRFGKRPNNCLTRRYGPATKKPCDLQGFFKRLMGLEPTSVCMAIV
jgi:hypothetical protein